MGRIEQIGRKRWTRQRSKFWRRWMRNHPEDKPKKSFYSGWAD